ncbi:MAG: hypothetical protein A3F69_01295 [Acidobacteria bacterium RIFCSPLOWO2_12_FULL_66_10]|nr:MAG: hypothetical protein A3F69_01295 [Acidobacteria bacterium RIFCSPLOWO2_12_FULL_66_10]
MADTARALIQRATLAACLTLTAAAHAAAQAAPQTPVVAPPPADPEFMSRFDFHLSIAALTPPTMTTADGQSTGDQRFSWDTRFGGSLDVVDYVVGRAAVLVDYQAVLGSEYRPFDPTQGNYTLETSSSVRLGSRTEIAGFLHHVSRHRSDRPKRLSVAFNDLGGRILQRVAIGGTTLDLDLGTGWVVQHSYVDYTWITEAHVLAGRALNDVVGVYAHASGQFFGVDGTVPDRGSQSGGSMEAGIRIKGRAGTLELFAGVEKRVDADPLDRQPQHWGLAGFRLLSR